MADIIAEIETLEHQLMRGWMKADQAVFRKHFARNVMMIVGTKRPQLLDRPSLIKAIESDFRCTGYRFNEVFVRQHGSCAWFTTRVDLEMKISGVHWDGQFWLTDMWIKSGLRRTRKLAERSLSRIDTDDRLPGAIRELQQWR